MTVLIDTDILIDIALKREPFFEDSVRIIDICEINKVIGFVAWDSLSNFYYLTSSDAEKKAIKQFLSDILQFIKVSPTNTESAKKALLMSVPDFEDALQISAAIECKADLMITRNQKHYSKSHYF
ncbi:MAG: PIN domain-containing protein [Ignavibacteria bacterium]|jgi:predicted nucleic acid-binding protein